jgi:hypothetical protein
MKRASALLRFLALSLCPVSAHADAPAGAGWWAGLDYGYASIARKYSVTGDVSRQKSWAAVRVGYAWDPRLLLGLEVGTWLLEGANLWHPNEGAGIETLALIAQYYPGAGPVYVKGGVAKAKYWTDNPDENVGDGSGGVVGLGYDFRWQGRRMYITPSIDYAWGRIDGATSPPGVTQDQKYRALTLKIGLTFR